MKRFILSCFLFLLGAAYLNAKLTHAEIALQNENAIVIVNALLDDGSTKSATGFIVSSEGVIATASHITKKVKVLNLTFKNGTLSDEAQILAVSSNPDIDLSLLKISVSGLPSVNFQNSNTVTTGQEITVIGNPRRLQNTVTDGLISQIRKISKTVNWFQISAPISPSSSGSPVFNDEGQVIAVALSSLKGADNQNINFAIPSNYLMRLMIENGITPKIDTMPTTVSSNSYFSEICAYVKKCWQILRNKLAQWFKF